MSFPATPGPARIFFYNFNPLIFEDLTRLRPSSPEGEGKRKRECCYNKPNAMTEKTIHEGRNVKRFREMQGMKQEALADALGDDWNQKKVSLLEAKEKIEPAILEEVAKALRIPSEAIKNFDEEKAIYAIQNNYDNSIAHNNFQYQPTFNPLDKYVEQVEENKKLYAAILKEKDEKIALLERMLEKK